jgi:hypothetical protein
MTLTPRQIAAYLEFSERLDRRDRMEALADTAIGTRGDQKAVEKVLRELGSS